MASLVRCGIGARIVCIYGPGAEGPKDRYPVIRSKAPALMLS